LGKQDEGHYHRCLQRLSEYAWIDRSEVAAHQKEEKLPFVPLEEELDVVISSVRTKMATFLRVLKYRNSFNYQARTYSVSELASLLQRAGWKVTEAYEDIVDLESFTHRAIFKASTSMTVVATAR
jgi:hypothetical protein